MTALDREAVNRGAADSAEAASGEFAWRVVRPPEGLAYRESGGRHDVVLLHGLGMSSSYFAALARELGRRGYGAVAPDVPGFGRSAQIAGSTPEEHSRVLAQWADRLGISGATWVGHSLGCNLVLRVAAARPDLVKRTALIGLVAQQRKLFSLRLIFCFARDAFHENGATYRFALRGMHQAGLLRWWNTWRHYLPELSAPPTFADGSLVIAGAHDPFTDRTQTRAVEVPGAHGCHVTHPRETAAVLANWMEE